ncbi:hypothetical protein [Mumia zhuanghuii]|uniref:Uncharacterized protein n=1 Tax=Mumia zhuanghuii TaxID=2585211 RepID=A0A5C4LW42_9ACTN|nr:hypothetical protein [Mumia zhuanghuii]TNC22171.1 hypothetical protein FHE65_35830 [Mumia zhuanghuii]
MQFVVEHGTPLMQGYAPKRLTDHGDERLLQGALYERPLLSPRHAQPLPQQPCYWTKLQHKLPEQALRHEPPRLYEQHVWLLRCKWPCGVGLVVTVYRAEAR